ncbi:MAG: SDR family NAD(P)-dependent oxidoreductase [Planctomycetaceae bacterium]|jgi:NAD(P)-dependent dehydrogenase (short-subunit alcohol dehydrogenase family)/rhamnose utilization protein RhaD (predicted bifunctional aldolase and dehydrogenase)|nr:SDR family NAD(P)-dependent oxidoreductase [Planctomycetaceae bacterium]
MGLEKLTEMSHRYGIEEYVLAGGGNTSFKNETTLYVKGSGTSLTDIQPEGFVAMDLAKLAQMLQANYPKDDASREAAALADMMAARKPGEEHKRPSVEGLLHGMFPYAYVLHVHPPMVNGLTCGKNGEKLCQELFGGKAVWVPLTKPGYILALTCKTAFDDFKAKTGTFPQIALLQNHGIFVAANTVEEIDKIMSDVMSALEKRLKRKPDMTDSNFDADAAAQIAPALRMLYSEEGKCVVVFCANRLSDEFTASHETMKPLMKPFSPDHIVYYKDAPLFVDQNDDMRKAFDAYRKEKGYLPKVVAVKGLGFFSLGASIREANNARLVFLDAMKVAVYAEAFGGYLQLPDAFTEFILNWEVEAYRQKAAVAGASSAGRITGKIALVTGGAQGIGAGIAQALAAEGSYVVVADLNLEGAKAHAGELNRTFGLNKAIAVRADVSDEQLVKAMVNAAVLAFGGLDILVSNAGVLFAGGLDEMTREHFDLVTKVNYTGYFLCVKHACVPMKIQREFSPGYTADIIEINSKSGLAGSNKNFAYAGSKFGGIGLTQSFAMELVEYGIKVNAICPGNLLDGPLWSDPNKGLFRQYLEAGKVPGAKTIADVRAFYEEKVPMKRGCEVRDMARAILYAVEQQYETGQAIPVTGGQIMK